jgi:hypothetical protein
MAVEATKEISGSDQEISVSLWGGIYCSSETKPLALSGMIISVEMEGGRGPTIGSPCVVV